LLISVTVTFVAFLVLATSKIHEIPAVMIAARAMMGITVGFSMPAATIYVSISTERFTDLDKLNFPMVVWFKAQANFQYCPSYLQKYCSI